MHLIYKKINDSIRTVYPNIGIRKIDLLKAVFVSGKKYSNVRNIPVTKTVTTNHPTKLPRGTPK
jgi:hypothetical protein